MLTTIPDKQSNYPSRCWVSILHFQLQYTYTHSMVINRCRKYILTHHKAICLNFIQNRAHLHSVLFHNNVALNFNWGKSFRYISPSLLPRRLLPLLVSTIKIFPSFNQTLQHGANLAKENELSSVASGNTYLSR